MRVGHAAKDITPSPGITLSGFAARRNQPSQAVDDPIYVRAVAVEEAGETVLLLVFDLLALGPEITGELRAAIDGLSWPGVSSAKTILCCTHTHSAPATIKLIGCGIPERSYRDLVVRSAAEAAREALGQMRPARLRYVACPVTGVNYNRRKVLTDGRVVMAMEPDAPVVRMGPTWDRMLLVRFDDDNGNGIAGLACWAGHPCVMCTPNISADYPGELCRRLSATHGFPFVYLQGAGGNLNLPFFKMTRPEMLADVDKLMERLPGISWPAPVESTPFGLANETVSLSYQAIPSAEELRAIGDGMRRIADTGTGPDSTIALLANILNVRPGETPDPAGMRYIAATMSEWSAGLLEDYDNLQRACEVALNVWTIGPLVFCAVAAEVFVETAIQLQRAFPQQIVTVIGYGSPLIGYLPTDEALREGGYEADSAYRFYGHPAPFAAGSEPAVLGALQRAINSRASSR